MILNDHCYQPAVLASALFNNVEKREMKIWVKNWLSRRHCKKKHPSQSAPSHRQLRDVHQRQPRVKSCKSNIFDFDDL